MGAIGKKQLFVYPSDQLWLNIIVISITQML